MRTRRQTHAQFLRQPEDRTLLRHMLFDGWAAVVLFWLTLALLDVVLMRTVDDWIARAVVRWLVLGVTAVVLSIGFTRRTLGLLSRAVGGERIARTEAEALADLTASIAAGNSIKENLHTAVHAAARMFGNDVRCTILLPSEDGLLRLAAYNNESSARIASFAFKPGEGFNGQAYSEGRCIRVDDLQARGDRRADIGRVSAMRSMVAAPLIADQRTLGVLTAISPNVAAFGEHEERMLTAIARNVAIGLVAAEAREAAQREAAKKAAIVAQMVDGVIVSDRAGTFIECNLAAAELLDMRQDELLGRTLTSAQVCDLFTPEGAPVDQGPLTRAVAGETVASEYRLLTRTGKKHWVWATASPLRAADGRLNGGILVLRDVARQRQAIKALRESEERYRRLVELCPDAILVYCDNKIVYVNAAGVTLAGVNSAQDLVGRDVTEFVAPERRETMLERARASLHGIQRKGVSEAEVRRFDGKTIHIESTTMLVEYEGKPAIQAIIRDVTERKHAEAALAHQALHDSLTGLPNRVLLMDRLQQALAVAHRDGSNVGLLLMDLDRFKEVNDTLGHHAGDLLLQQVGARLRGALREADTIARLGGDEFAVILPATGPTGVSVVAETLRGQLQAPFVVEGQSVIVGASIGIAVSPLHGEEGDALLRRADVAMYIAKRNGTGCAMYRADADPNSPDRLVLISELRQAGDRGELVLHYQPKVDLHSGAITGVEALVRWQHPVRGLLTPDEFVPIAEQAALIESLGQWVLRTAVDQASSWRRAELEMPVAVNLSMHNLQDDRLPERVAELLREAEVPPSLLVVEITESTLMQDAARTLAILDRLRATGVRVAIDDFGTGHSSLAYLKRLSVDEVKIDRAFVQDMVTDGTDRVIVRSTVELAHSLKLRVVAEGVENQITAAVLAELGCDEAQGYHVSPPLRGEELPGWVRARGLPAAHRQQHAA